MDLDIFRSDYAVLHEEFLGVVTLVSLKLEDLGSESLGVLLTDFDDMTITSKLLMDSEET